MQNGTISGNIAGSNVGGGVKVLNGSTFTMSGGTISGNTTESGGGVWVEDVSTFTMSGSSTISGNNAVSGGGGGVRVIDGSTFTMSGGTISGNTGKYQGGGVYTSPDSSFRKSGSSVITGYDSDTGGNKVVDYSSAVITDGSGGHAVYAANNTKGNPRRNNTVPSGEALSYTGNANEAYATLGGVWTTTP
jgi:hypothetical protein